ncbi:uncharacterized protein [Dysidea avara]
MDNELPTETVSWKFQAVLVFFLLWQFRFTVSDAAMIAVFQFMYWLFRMLAVRFVNEQQVEIEFPRTLKFATKLAGIDPNAFVEYIVCPKCGAIFTYELGYTQQGSQKVPNRCPYIEYPNHPHASKRLPCGAYLMKTVKTRNGKMTVKPYKVFAYQPLKTAVSRLANRKGFIDLCEKWRTRVNAPDGVMYDIYDGQLWKDFQVVDGDPFLESKFSWSFSLNVDFFQPYSHTQYSVGVIYLSLNNLPRSIRYKRENIIIVGIIPGPKEPKLTMNAYLMPLVQDLEEFWIGVNIKCNNYIPNTLCIRAAVICCASDIPASRKLCGFVAHSATLGCSKCLKPFPSEKIAGVKRTDYSGFEKETWQPRSLSVHVTKALEYLHADSEAERKRITKGFGVRYSCLVELSYFDPIRFSVVDPMHNLYLGTAKHMMNIWVDNKILTKHHFDIIEEIVAKITTPHDVGRIPLKISSGFSGFTADQWRNWTTIFSPVALKEVLPAADLCCWLLFVRACCLLSNRCISADMVHQAHAYLIEFCKKVELLYGRFSATPNLHLHLHLNDCLLDYGPVHAFWCYAFERCNGLLGRYHTNNEAIEVQLMRKFLREQQILSADVPSEASDVLGILHSSPSGSLLESSYDPYSETILKLQLLARCHLNGENDFSLSPSDTNINLLLPHFEGVLTTSQKEKLLNVYKFLYPNLNFAHFSSFYEYSSRCVVAKEMFCTTSAKERSSVVMAVWPAESLSDPGQKQVGRIQKIIRHSTKASGSLVERHHVFCMVEWYNKHRTENWYGTSATICTNITNSENSCSYLPIQRISHRCAYGNLKVIIPPRVSEEEIFVAIPIDLKFLT